MRDEPRLVLDSRATGDHGAPTKRGRSTMNPTRAQANRGMQRDLRVWWWAIMAVGFNAAVVFLALPASGATRALVLAWLIAFAAIGLYQRRRTLAPPAPCERADPRRDRLSQRARAATGSATPVAGAAG